MTNQPFSPDGDLLCLDCLQPIGHGQFYLVLHERHDIDTDAQLAIHLSCLPFRLATKQDTKTSSIGYAEKVQVADE